MTSETTRENDARIDRRTDIEPQPTLADGSGIESDIEQIAADLSDFQTKALLTLASEDRYGLGIKQRLSEYYGEEINHGRLYPNLDELVDHGLVDKSERDRRTNNYAITERGRRVVQYEHWWIETEIRGEE